MNLSKSHVLTCGYATCVGGGEGRQSQRMPSESCGLGSMTRRCSSGSLQKCSIKNFLEFDKVLLCYFWHLKCFVCTNLKFAEDENKI
jgi:hypothetical protein